MYYPRMGFISYCDFPINNIDFLPCHSWLPKGCCFVWFLGVVPNQYISKLNPEFLLLRSSWLYELLGLLSYQISLFPSLNPHFLGRKLHVSRGLVNSSHDCPETVSTAEGRRSGPKLRLPIQILDVLKAATWLLVGFSLLLQGYCVLIV